MAWLAEDLYPDWAQSFRVIREVVRERSAFQDIVIVETASHGRVLLLDGVVQITETDEYAYQEMIAHVPLIEHGSAKDVLIIGAGDGGVLRRVLQHGTVSSATMVEIDEAVIRLSRSYLTEIGGSAWSDPRATIIVGDGVMHLAKTETASLDIIIVDSTDPAGPGEGLFTAAFYSDCARALRPAGILVNQCGVPFMQATELSLTTALRRQAFMSVSAYVAAVPTYVGGLMAIGISTHQPLRVLSVPAVRARAKASAILGTTRYWSPSVHVAAFALPPFIAELVPELGNNPSVGDSIDGVQGQPGY